MPETMELLARGVAAPLHRRLVANNRTSRLARVLAELVDRDRGQIGLDIGCGDGALSNQIELLAPNVRLTGTDVLARPDALIPVIEYNGTRLSFPDKSFDFCMLVDVLHHTPEARIVLKEACRVTRQFVLIKDHYCENHFDRLTLRFMDWVGNRAYGVALPYNYLSKAQWRSSFQACNLTALHINEHLSLYGWPGSMLFERGLHFVAKLRVE